MGIQESLSCSAHFQVLGHASDHWTTLRLMGCPWVQLPLSIQSPWSKKGGLGGQVASDTGWLPGLQRLVWGIMQEGGNALMILAYFTFTIQPKSSFGDVTQNPAANMGGLFH